MDESAVQIKVPNDVIRSVVMAEIMKQIGDPGEVFGELVGHYLGESVEKAQYSRQKVPRWEKMFMRRLEDVSQECVAALVDEMRPQIQVALKKKLTSNRIAGGLAEALEAAVSTSSWSIKLELRRDGD